MLTAAVAARIAAIFPVLFMFFPLRVLTNGWALSQSGRQLFSARRSTKWPAGRHMLGSSKT
jgi:ABC-type phosphate/phosphonate transport system permease subunit